MYTEDEIPYNFYPQHVADVMFGIVRKNNKSIVERFYQQLLANAKSSEFLIHEEIETRLKASFRDWLEYTFDRNRVLADPKSFCEYQDNIGRVHSRVDISLQLINYAKVVLKRCLFELDLSNTKNPTEFVCYISDVIDYAVDTFNQSYLKEVIDTTRHMQSLRVVASGHQLALDLERGKGEVAAWARDTVWNVSQGASTKHKTVSDLNIYHWLKHKGSFTFTNEGMSQTLLSACEDLLGIEASIDSHLIAVDSSARKSALNDLIQTVMQISDRVGEKLDEAIHVILEAEERRDALTKALSRRYLPAVAQREVVFAKHSGTPFCVLMIDIDDFKAVNDEHGHRAGDEVLEKVAYTLIERVRPGDYIFRYGGEEFLAIISETELEVAAHIAEDIRRQVQAQECTASDVERIHVSVSIGVAEFDFHPDFMRTVEAADKRLYQAKRAGKNRVVWAN